MRIFYHLYFTLLALLLLTSAHAQKQADWWYFGSNSGVHFVNGVPQAVTNGQCNTTEGCAALSDAQGNLLMYTDGISIWNSNHATMQNGTGLYGDPSSSQSGIIVPKPGTNNIFYVFSVDAYNRTHGLNYSVVDLSYNAGLGNVTSKNIALTSKAVEKITSVKHTNGTDYWVMCTPGSNDSMYAYLVTSSGVSSTYVASYTGDNLVNKGDLGHLKVSPDGKRIAFAKYNDSKIFYGDFDASTGKCSNIYKLDSFNSPYGIEFSANSNLLYAANCGHAGTFICQYNLNAGTSTQVKNSVKKIFATSSNTMYGALQLASNGKIYVAKLSGDTLGEISFADSLYPQCKYKSNAVYLNGKQSQLGLPTFIQSFFLIAKFNYWDTCVLNTTKFSVMDSSGIDSVRWVFGDSTSGSNDSAYTMITQHQYSRTGDYNISLYYWYNGIADTASKIITIDSLPPAYYFPKDTIMCGTTKIQLSVPNKSNYSYKWSTGDTTTTILVDSPGVYWVEMSNFCGSVRDSVNVLQYINPTVNLGNDTTYCTSFSQLLDASNSNCQYLWSTGDTSSQITVTQPGTYWVKVYNTCFSLYDTVSIFLKSIPHPNLGNDTFTCNTISYNLNAACTNSHYLWNTGDTNSSYVITLPGTYWVKAYNECGQNTDTINIKKVIYPSVSLGNDTFYCNAFDQILDATSSGAKYLWSSGDTVPVIHATGTGVYGVQVSNECGNASDSVNIILYNLPLVDLGNDTTYCSKFSQKLDVFNPFCNYIWSTGDTLSNIIIKNTGTYYVNVYNKCWQKSDTISVVTASMPIVNLGNDTAYCGQFSRDFDVTSSAGDRYIWNTNDTTPIYHISAPNTYSIKIYNFCFSVTDSIKIEQQSFPYINLGNDTSFCTDFNFLIDPKNTSYNYIWSTGDTSKNITVTNAGTYWAQASNNCGTTQDSIDIFRTYKPSFLNLGNDTTLCLNESINLSQQFGNMPHIWSNGDTSSSITISKPGTYWAKVTDQTCSYFDTIRIYNFPNNILKLSSTKTLCEDLHETVVFNAPGYMLYNWQPGNIITDSIQIQAPGIYTLFVTDSFGCKQSDSVEVIEICPPKVWLPNAFTPGHKDTLNDVFKPTLFMVDTYTLDIYNRWGEHIYSGTEQDAGWDGTYRGVNCNTDIYIWTVTYNSHLLTKYTRGGNASGVVYVIR